jgi:hypothetical protein
MKYVLMFLIVLVSQSALAQNWNSYEEKREVERYNAEGYGRQVDQQSGRDVQCSLQVQCDAYGKCERVETCR